MFQFHLHVLMYFVFCTFRILAQLQETSVDFHREQHNINLNDNDRTTLELKRRKEIAENYFRTLPKAKETWIDPYDMISYPLKENSVDEKTVENSLGNDEKPVFSDIKGDIIDNNIIKVGDSLKDSNAETAGHFTKDRQQICVLDSIYISRWLKKLISKIEEESNLQPISVTFPQDASVLDNLKELSTAKSLEITELDELICSMIAKATISRKENYNWLILLENLKPILWGIACVFIALFFFCVCYQCIIYNPKLTVLSCGIILSIFWHWMHLYKQKQAQHYAEVSSMKIPDQCQKHEFGLFNHIHYYFKSFFTRNDECARYYEALMVDPFWEVSFTVAAAEAISAMLFQPLSAASRNINLFFKQLFDGLPITVMITMVMLFILLLIMFFNYRIKFLIGSIEPSPPSVGSRIEDVQPAERLVSAVKTLNCPERMLKRSIDSKTNASESVQDCCEFESGGSEEVNVITSHEPSCVYCPRNCDLQDEHEECKVSKSDDNSKDAAEVCELSSELLGST